MCHLQLKRVLSTDFLSASQTVHCPFNWRQLLGWEAATFSTDRTPALTQDPFINKTSHEEEAQNSRVWLLLLFFFLSQSASGPDARGEQEPDMSTSVGGELCVGGTAERAGVTSHGWPPCWWFWLHVWAVRRQLDPAHSVCPTQRNARFLARFGVFFVCFYVLPFHTTSPVFSLSSPPPSSPLLLLVLLSLLFYWRIWENTARGAEDLTHRWSSELWQLKRNCTPKWPRGGSARPGRAPSNMGPLWTCCCPWASPRPGRE